MILPKLRVLFSATVRCGVYLKSTCNSAANSLGLWANQIEQQPTRIASTTSVFLVVNEVGIFFNHPTSAYSMFHPMGQDFPQWSGCTSRLWNHWMPGSLCAVFFLSPTSTCRWLCRAVLVAIVFCKKKERRYFYSVAVNQQALLKYWLFNKKTSNHHWFFIVAPVFSTTIHIIRKDTISSPINSLWS